MFIGVVLDKLKFGYPCWLDFMGLASCNIREHNTTLWLLTTSSAVFLEPFVDVVIGLGLNTAFSLIVVSAKRSSLNEK